MCIPAALKNLSLKKVLLLLAVVSAAILSTALIGQYGFGLHPCELCMAQRYPYIAIILLGVAGFFISSRRALLGIGWLIALLFLADAGIALYHAGVELKWFPGPSACTSTPAPANESIDDMRRAIMNAPLVSCDQPMFYFLGLSMAAWNCVTASFLFLATSVLLWKKR